LTSTSLDFLSNFAKVILCGDFNAHHGLWGSEYTNCSEWSLVVYLDVHDLVVRNTTTPTHFSLTGRNAWSLLDLVLVSSSYASLCTWTVTSKILGSDHSIVIASVNVNTMPEDHGVPKWNFSKADWQIFSAACYQTLASFSIPLGYAYCIFETSVREAPLEAIPNPRSLLKSLFHGGISSATLLWKRKSMPSTGWNGLGF